MKTLLPPPPTDEYDVATASGPPSLTPACPYEAAEMAEPIRRPTGLALAIAKALCATWGHDEVEETYIDSHGGLDGILRCKRCGAYIG
jgi:hypothetical protein